MNRTAIQPLRSTIIHIRSKDADDLTNGVYNTNFRVNIMNPVLCELSEQIHISVMSCEIPYSFYNISAELKNNTLVYDNTTLTFTSQDYSIDDLMDYFSNDSSFSSVFSAAYNTQTNKITFTNITNASHTLKFSQSTLNKVIGYDEEASDVVLSAGATSTSSGVCNLATVHSIMIKCSVGQGNVISTRAGNSATLQKVSVDVNSNSIIYLNQQDFRQVSVSQAPIIDTMEFRFTDQNDNLLQLNNCNFEFSMLFEVFPKSRDSVLHVEQAQKSDIPSSRQPLIIEDDHPFEKVNTHEENRLVLDDIIDRIEAET